MKSNRKRPHLRIHLEFAIAAIGFLSLVAAADEGVHDLFGGAGEVFDLVFGDNGKLYVAGRFGSVGDGVEAKNLAIWQADQSLWTSILGGDPVFSGDNKFSNTTRIRALKILGPNHLIVGGEFFDQAGDTPVSTNIAEWENGQWSSMSSGTGDITDIVSAIEEFDNLIIAGGGFESMGDVEPVVNNIAIWVPGNEFWLALEDKQLGQIGVTDVTGSIGVFDLAVNLFQDQLIIGGSFAMTFPTPQPKCGDFLEEFDAFDMVVWDGSNFGPLGTMPEPCFDTGIGEGNGNTEVRALERSGSSIFFGGDFGAVLNVPGESNLNNIGSRAFNGVFNPLGTAKSNGVDGTVRSIAVGPQGDVFVAGEFTTVLDGSMTVNDVARWSPASSQWSPLVDTDTGVAGLPGSDVIHDVAVDPDTGDVYVGGRFVEAGGKPATSIARWDGQRWHPLVDQQPAFDLQISEVGDGNDPCCDDTLQQEPAGDQIELAVATGAQASLEVIVENDSDETETVTLQAIERLIGGMGSLDALWATEYTVDSEDITSAIESTQGFVQELAPGESLTIEIETQPGEIPSQLLQVDLRARSLNATGIDDIVRAEIFTDCNDNGIADRGDILNGDESDCNNNNVPDSCEIDLGLLPDLNVNGVPDVCEDLVDLQPQPVQTIEADGDVVDNPVAADVNGDDLIDLNVAVVNQNGNQQVVTFAADAENPGQFINKDTIISDEFDFAMDDIVFGDLDCDGDEDLVVLLANGTVHPFLNNGTGLFSPAGVFDVPSLTKALDIAHLNGDDKPDVATIGDNDPVTDSREQAKVINLGVDGNGEWLGFAPADQVSVVQDAQEVQVVDFTGDGDNADDIASFQGENSELNVQENNGEGLFEDLFDEFQNLNSFEAIVALNALFEAGTEFEQLALQMADLDCDGAQDDIAAVAVNSETGDAIIAAWVITPAAQSGLGPGSLGNPVPALITEDVGPELGSLNQDNVALQVEDVLADDNKPEVILENTDTGDRAVFINGGVDDEGLPLGFLLDTFTEGKGATGPGAAGSPVFTQSAFGDFDNDGIASDFATANLETNQLIVFNTDVTTPTPCPEDIAGDDNVVNVQDLLLLLGNWGTDGAGSDLAEPNNIVDVADLLALLGAWGACP